MKKLLALIALSFFIVTLINLNFILAIPPFVQSGTNLDKGYIIEYPSFSTIKQNTTFDFHFHLYNISDGLPINSSSVGCLFHLYNHQGDHIFISNNYILENNVDFTFSILGTNFSSKGYYAYLIQCNNTIGGYDKIPLIVTGNGLEPAGENFSIFIYLLFIISMIGLIAMLFLTIAKLATASETLFGVLTSWAFYILMILVNYLAGNFLIETFVKDISDISLTIFVWTNGVLPIISLIITMIIKSTKKGQNLSIDELTGRRFTYGY